MEQNRTLLSSGCYSMAYEEHKTFVCYDKMGVIMSSHLFSNVGTYTIYNRHPNHTE